MGEIEVLDFERAFSYSPGEGVIGRPLFGANTMLTVVTFEPNAFVPMHRHPQEQLGIVLGGLEVLIVDGEEHELIAMQGYAIPADVEHGARIGPDGAIGVEVFHPLRDDYLEAASGGSPTPFR